MSKLKIALRHSDVRIGQYVRYSLSTIFLVIGLQIAVPVNAAETGIKGKILWGPVVPGPKKIGKGDEAPLQATFIVMKSQKKVASFESDAQGNFSVILPAGTYAIVADKSKRALFPGEQKKTVTVPKDGFATITLRYDTGMR